MSSPEILLLLQDHAERLASIDRILPQISQTASQVSSLSCTLDKIEKSILRLGETLETFKEKNDNSFSSLNISMIQQTGRIVSLEETRIEGKMSRRAKLKWVGGMFAGWIVGVGVPLTLLSLK